METNFTELLKEARPGSAPLSEQLYQAMESGDTESAIAINALMIGLEENNQASDSELSQ